MSKPTHETEHKKKAIKKYSTVKDAREHEGAGQYPNYWSHKTRSGHSIIMDDSKDHESITIQHRGGSAIQFHPDGQVQMTSHNGKYDVVFGENRVSITGANDMTVKGDGTLLVYGDLHHTIHGNYNKTVTGSFNMTCDNYNAVVRGNQDFMVKGDKTTKIGGNSVEQVNKTKAIAAGDDIVVGASKTATFGGTKGTGITSDKNIVVSSKSGEIHHTAKGFQADIQGKYVVGATEMSHQSSGRMRKQASRIELQMGADSPQTGTVTASNSPAARKNAPSSVTHLA